MLPYILNSALQAAERGLVPDVAIRFIIHKLLKQRLQAESHGTCEDWLDRQEAFIAEARRGPIALVPSQANEQHYELPSEFFKQALGRHLKYSCCYWPHEIRTLEEAENTALNVTSERAEIQDGMTILDLGCGWGSLSLWIAQRYTGCQVTAVSNSKTQKQFIERQAASLGLSKLRVISADVNDFRAAGRFDRVVSIEMFEHMRNHEELFRRIETWLEPDGKLFVHIFCHRQFVYPFETQGAHNWMGRCFFTGGMMPSDDLLLRYQSDLRLEHQWRWNGKHYSKTCNAWLANMDRKKRDIMSIFEKTYGTEHASKWFMRWRFFFMACAELFAINDGNEWWVSHYLFSKHT